MEKVIEVKESIVEKIAVTLMQDITLLWNNVDNDAIIAQLKFCNGKRMQLIVRKNQKMSENCTNLARGAKIAEKATYACIVKSFISDNKQKILTMWRSFIFSLEGSLPTNIYK